MKNLVMQFTHSDDVLTRDLLRERQISNKIISNVLAKYRKYYSRISNCTNIRKSKLYQAHNNELKSLYGSRARAVLALKKCLLGNTSLRFCPYCGINPEPATLDHYIAMSIMPEFSLYAPNLVPSCSMCNVTEKRAKKAVIGGRRQFFHPYFDDLQDAEVLKCSLSIDSSNRILIEYDISNFGNPHLKEILKRHLSNMDLKYRFGERAKRYLVDKAEAYKKLIASGAVGKVSRDLRNFKLVSKADNGVNHWQTALLNELVSNSSIIIHLRNPRFLIVK